HQHLGRAPVEGAQPLYTRNLAQVIEYVPADLTITVEAGVTLGQIQALLQPNRQWLPWDPPCGAPATIGGLLASGRVGPLRYGYGTPRDWVLGMRVALGDGRLVRSGARVVKNVAGYDMHKLHLGALGTLGVIAEATLKIAPLPEATATLLVHTSGLQAALEAAEALRRPPHHPASLVILDPHGSAAPAWRVVVRYAGVQTAVTRLAGEAQQRIAAVDGAALADVSAIEAEQAAIWQPIVEFPTPAEQAITLRIGVPASALGMAFAALQRHAAPAACAGYPGIGLVYARWPLPAASNAAGVGAALTALREELRAAGGYAVVEAAPESMRALLDLWGPAPDTLAIMRSIKQRWDPHGILNHGRYAGNI
ncbi:MAG TPA: FAD-binding oxidoreductase, partial [Roseiflexaceae bacterium]|nr:FAD-binding oxidoreductase [Roseiflexaceae bacterium]